MTNPVTVRDLIAALDPADSELAALSGLPEALDLLIPNHWRRVARRPALSGDAGEILNYLQTPNAPRETVWARRDDRAEVILSGGAVYWAASFSRDPLEPWSWTKKSGRSYGGIMRAISEADAVCAYADEHCD
jgi:hypothetical protein